MRGIHIESDDNIRDIFTTWQFSSEHFYGLYFHCIVFGGTGDGGRDSLTFGTGVLMCLFGICNLGWAKFVEVWNLEVPDVLSVVWIWGRRDYLWSDILVCSCSSHFLSIKFFFSKLDGMLFGVFEKLVWLFGGLRKLLDISTPVPKDKESPQDFVSQLSPKSA